MIGGGAILACSAARRHPPVAALCSNMCYTPRRRTSSASRRRAVGSRMAASSKIALHHVGGRWGNHPFPRLPAFVGDFVEVLYEADTDAIAAIREAGKDRPSELIVIPACLADRDGDGLLHIYVNPGLTSLRGLNRVLDHRIQNTFG